MADLSVLVRDWFALQDREPTRRYVQYYTAASTTWTAPTGVTSVTVELWGGGGTGGTAQNNSAGYAGGGAGGQYAIKATTVTPGSNYTVAIAQAKSAVADSTINGDDSTFATTTVVAKGGAGAVPTGSTYGSGASGSSGSGVGDQIYAGGSGGNGGGSYSGGGGGGAGSTGDGNPGNNGDTSNGTGGAAKTEYGGKGGDGVAASNARNAGESYGGGGSGGCSKSTTNRAGGAGGAGFGRLTWTLPYGSGRGLHLESVVLTDPVTAVLTPCETSASETVTVTDPDDQVLEPLIVPATDTLTLTDQIIYLKVVLRQGDTVIATRSASPTTEWATTAWTLTAAELAAISDWTALRVALSVSGRQANVSWVQLEAPAISSAEGLTRSVPDDVTLTDSGTAVLDPLLGAVADTVTLSDAPDVACDAAGEATDLLALSDLAAGVLDPLILSASDTLTLSEDAPVVVDVAVAATDTIPVDDVAEVDNDLVVDTSETVTLADRWVRFDVALLQGATTIARWTVDPTASWATTTVTLTEAERAAITDWAGLRLALVAAGRAVQVSAAFLETPVATGTWTPALSDETLTLGDVSTVVLDPLLPASDDTVTLTDPVTATTSLQSAVSDAVTIGDSAEGVVTPAVVAVADTVTLSDEWISGALEARAAETITLGDVRHGLTLELYVGATRIATWTLAPTDTFATTTVTLSAAQVAAVTDWTALRVGVRAEGRQAAVSWVELTAPGQWQDCTVRVTETVTLTDPVQRQRLTYGPSLEQILLSDTATASMRAEVRIYAITVSVPVTPTIPLEAQPEDDITVLDDLGPFPITVGRSDRVTVTDIATRVVTPLLPTGIGTETVTLSDSGRMLTDLNVEATDTVTLGETVPLGVWADDTITWSDTGTQADAADRYAPVTDLVTVSEAREAALTPLLAPISDQGGLTLTDATTARLDPLCAPGSDTLTLTETGTTATMGWVGSDTATVGESGTLEYWRPITIADVPTVQRVRMDGAEGEESLRVTDVPEAAINRHDARPRADAVVVGDLGWGFRTGPYIEARAADTVTVGLSGWIEVVKGITITDVVDVRRLDDTRFVSRAEPLTLSDSARGEMPDVVVLDRLTLDEGGEVEFWEWAAPLTISDGATLRLTPLEGPATDTLTVGDAGTPQLADLWTERRDDVWLSDRASGDRPPIVVVSDLVAVTESARGQPVLGLVLTALGAELVTVSADHVSVGVPVMAGDTLTLNDVGLVVVTPLEVTRLDVLPTQDVALLAVDPLLAAHIERLTLTDRAEHSRCDGVGTETLTLSDTATATVTVVTVTDVPTARTWRVLAEPRTFRVAAEARTWTVPAEARGWRVPLEDRTWESEREA